MFATSTTAFKSTTAAGLSMARSVSGTHALAASRSNAAVAARAALKTPLATPNSMIVTRAPSMSLSMSHGPETPTTTLNLMLNLTLDAPISPSVRTMQRTGSRTVLSATPTTITPGASTATTMAREAFARAAAETGFKQASALNLVVPKAGGRRTGLSISKVIKKAVAVVRFSELPKNNVSVAVVEAGTPTPKAEVRQFKSCRDRVPTPYPRLESIEGYFA